MMRIELLDEPVLFIKSKQSVKPDSSREALEHIETVLQGEIEQVRRELSGSGAINMQEYFGSFGLHSQIPGEVNSVLFESEWEEQIKEEKLSAEEMLEQDLEVSELRRVILLHYEARKDPWPERRLVLSWLGAGAKSNWPCVIGVGTVDFLFVPARDIILAMNDLESFLKEKGLNGHSK